MSLWRTRYKLFSDIPRRILACVVVATRWCDVIPQRRTLLPCTICICTIGGSNRLVMPESLSAPAIVPVLSKTEEGSLSLDL